MRGHRGMSLGVVVAIWSMVIGVLVSPVMVWQAWAGADTVAASVQARTQLDGRPLRNAEFTFELLDGARNVVRTTSNDGSGSVQFGSLLFTKRDVGEHFYSIREVKQQLGGVEYDTAQHAVRILVEGSEESALSVSVTYPTSVTEDSGGTVGQTPASDLPVFVNRYRSQGTLTLRAHKRMVGAELRAGQFTFDIYAKEDADRAGAQPLRSAVNDGNGLVAFDPVSFTQDDIVWPDSDSVNWREYVVRERSGDENGVIYDGHEETLRVKLKDDGKGTLTPETHLQDQHMLEWVNHVADGDLSITKQVTSGDEDAEFEFTVDFTAPAGASLPDGSYAVDYEYVGNTNDADSTERNDSPENGPMQAEAQPVMMEADEVQEAPQLATFSSGPPEGLTAQADGNIASGTWGSCSWTIDRNGVLTVGAGEGANLNGLPANVPWYEYRSAITSVTFEATVTFPARVPALFYDCANVTSIDLSHVDTSKVTAMNNMFNGCMKLQSVTWPDSLNTSRVTTMQNMFNRCRSLQSLDLSKFNTSKVTNMSGMFYECWGLTSLDVSSFDTAQVQDMSYMFYNCSRLPVLNVSEFDTANVTNMSSMFYKCASLPSLDVSHFNTAKVKNMSYMFYECSRLPELVLPETFDTRNVTDMKHMFNNCSSLTRLDLPAAFDTSQVKSMDQMFRNCSSLTQLRLPAAFNTSQVTTMHQMFRGCSALQSLDLSTFNTANVTDMSYMFYECSKMTQLVLPKTFDTSRVTTMKNMFNGCSSLASIDTSMFNTANVQDMYGMFTACWSLTELDVSTFNTANVTDMAYMFYNCTRIKSLDLPDTFDTSQVISMVSMFHGCAELTTLELPETFNTANVTTMAYMFYGCTQLPSLTLPVAFDTSKVTDMKYMFYLCSQLRTLQLPEAFQTPNVTSMEKMFFQCASLDSLDLSGFDTSQLTETKAVELMFSGTSSLKRVCLGKDWFKSDLMRNNSDTYPYSRSTIAIWTPESEAMDPVVWHEIGANYGQGNDSYQPGWYRVWDYYTVKFNANGGEGQMASATPAANRTYTLPSNIVYRYQHEFMGWNTQPDGSGQAYADGSSIPGYRFKVGDVLTLYAQWKNIATPVQVVKGRLTITVPAGYKAVIKNLPGGTSYQITEHPKSGWQLAQWKNTTGVIASNASSDARFVNEYALGTVQVQLSARKLLDGAQPGSTYADAFQFELADNTGTALQIVKNNRSSVLFDPITYTQAGEYEYTMRELATLESLPVNYDARIFRARVTVTEDETGALAAAVTYYSDADDEVALPAFANTMKPGEVVITLESKYWHKDGFPFTLELTREGQICDATVHSENGTAFKNASSFTLTESARALTLVDVPDGVTVRAVQHLPIGYVQTDETVDSATAVAAQTHDITIYNERHLAGTAVPHATKVFEGGELTDGQFHFLVKNEQKEIVSRGTNTADGAIVFDAIPYTEQNAGSTYSYTMTEIADDAPEHGNIMFDDNIYEFSVTVTDDGTGVLQTVIRYGDSGPQDPPVFTNHVAYELPSTGAGTGNMLIPMGMGLLLLAGMLAGQATSRKRYC